MRSATGTLIVLALAAVFVAGACGDGTPEKEKKGDSTLRRDSLPVPADTTLSDNLPAGRYHIPTRHTPVPDFFITLPEGYMVKNLSQLPNDEYFIVQSDDPSLKDSTAVTPGFLLFYVGVQPQGALPDRGRPASRKFKLGPVEVTMKMWADTLPDGRLYYIRDVASSDYFRKALPELADAPLHLHIYVAGSDSARVAALVRGVEGFSFKP